MLISGGSVQAAELRIARGQQVLALGYGLIPSVLLGTNQLSPSIPTIAPWMTVFTSMFLHGGVLHLAGNMVYLWVFGRTLEGALAVERLGDIVIHRHREMPL